MTPSERKKGKNDDILNSGKTVLSLLVMYLCLKCLKDSSITAGWHPIMLSQWSRSKKKSEPFVSTQCCCLSEQWTLFHTFWSVMDLKYHMPDNTSFFSPQLDWDFNTVSFFCESNHWCFHIAALISPVCQQPTYLHHNQITLSKTLSVEGRHNALWGGQRVNIRDSTKVEKSHFCNVRRWSLFLGHRKVPASDK